MKMNTKEEENHSLYTKLYIVKEQTNTLKKCSFHRSR